MYGILIHTGTSGSEGTLGGLVETGRQIGEHILAALDEARLCSNDRFARNMIRPVNMTRCTCMVPPVMGVC